jgi:hypothetical protein
MHFIQVKRAINHLDREVQQLEGVKTKLVADLKDKVGPGRYTHAQEQQIRQEQDRSHRKTGRKEGVRRWRRRYLGIDTPVFDHTCGYSHMAALNTTHRPRQLRLTARCCPFVRTGHLEGQGRR